MEGDVEGEQEQRRAQIEPDQGYSVPQEGKRQSRGILEEPNVRCAGDDEPSEEIHQQHCDKYPAGRFCCLTNRLRSDHGEDRLWKHGSEEIGTPKPPDPKPSRMLEIRTLHVCLSKVCLNEPGAPEVSQRKISAPEIRLVQ